MYSFFDRTPPPDFVFDERHHNCSGKHAGFFALCQDKGWTITDYLDPTHALQQAILQMTGQATTAASSQISRAIDGCSAPTFSMPLANLALGFARLAGDRQSDLGECFEVLCHAMIQHGDLVSGTDRNDAHFMSVGNGDWVSKIGADGGDIARYAAAVAHWHHGEIRWSKVLKEPLSESVAPF